MRYFDDDKNKDRLRKELSLWTGTKFQYSTSGKAEPGIVADCVSFPINLYKRMGLISKDYKTPVYCSRPTVSGQLNLIFKDMDENLPGLKSIWKKDNDILDKKIIIAGDIIVCSFRNSVHHLVVSSGDDFVWDCWPKIGVRKIPINTGRIILNAKRIYRWELSND